MHRILSLALICFLGLIFLNYGCTKLDTTTLGGDVLPEVDNINTFADTFFVTTTQGDYEQIDSTLLANTDNHVLGMINSDILFGKTTANLYLQLKPTSFPFGFGAKDSIIGVNAGLDSVVLCLSYQGSYGDTNILQQLQVYEINDNVFKDSAYPTNYEPAVGNLLKTTSVDIRTLSDVIRYTHIKDSATNQIRIRLDPGLFTDRLYASDSSLGTAGGNHAFVNDSIFRKEFQGFGIKAISGNALMYINLADTNTKLEVHYRRRSADNKVDTLYSSFKFRTFTSVSGTTTFKSSTRANYIKRERTSLADNPLPGEIYLQSQPGTYANLHVDSFTGYSNRIIHRADLTIEQIPGDLMQDSIFAAPNYLYLDLKDTGAVNTYKPIYIDLNPSIPYDPDNSANYYPGGNPDLDYFGGFARRKTGPFGGSIIYYNINISRYVQRMVKTGGYNFDMRLFAPSKLHYRQYNSYLPYSN
ncbi:MAG: DUF4270 family protein, partial [Ferruginibacter sp.]